MFSSVIYNLKNLLNFHGGDSRRVYWHYFFFVVFINLLVLGYAALPTIFGVVGEVGQNASGQSSEAVEAAVLEKMIASGLIPSLVKYGLALGMLNIVLFTASVARRVRDAGLSTMIVITPVGLQFLWMYFSYRQLQQLEATVEAADRLGSNITEIETGMVVQDLIGWLVVLILVVIGFIKSRNIPDVEAA